MSTSLADSLFGLRTEIIQGTRSACCWLSTSAEHDLYMDGRTGVQWIGWQFVAAEFAGGLTTVALLTVMLRGVMTQQRIMEAKRQKDRGLAGRMEAHAAMDMSVSGEGSILARITSPKGFTAIRH